MEYAQFCVFGGTCASLGAGVNFCKRGLYFSCRIQAFTISFEAMLENKGKQLTAKHIEEYFRFC